MAVIAKCLHKDTLLGNGKTIGEMYYHDGDTSKHGLNIDALRMLPDAISDPICIFRSEGNHKNSIEVITEIKEGDLLTWQLTTIVV
ncbi:MAG: hypothetical protein ACI4OX_07185 [Akkermansia sp.]